MTPAYNMTSISIQNQRVARLERDPAGLRSPSRSTAAARDGAAGDGPAAAEGVRRRCRVVLSDTEVFGVLSS